RVGFNLNFENLFLRCGQRVFWRHFVGLDHLPQHALQFIVAVNLWTAFPTLEQIGSSGQIEFTQRIGPAVTFETTPDQNFGSTIGGRIVSLDETGKTQERDEERERASKQLQEACSSWIQRT